MVLIKKTLDKPIKQCDNVYSEKTKEVIMSCIENEIILENLYEKYLDLGYDEDMASELAFEEFANLQ